MRPHRAATGVGRRAGWCALGATLLVVVGGCSESPSALVPEPLLRVVEQDDFVFMTQNRVPADVMSALFTGPVIADAEGCLRLGSGQGSTVVWPLGYTLDASGAAPRVLDEHGEPVGRLGETFALGGGEVETLLESMGFTAEDRERSGVCPGRYWVVAPAG